MSITQTSCLRKACQTNRRVCATLFVLCMALFLPGLWALPPLDRDEARFAQASKQMIASGDYIDIRFQAEARYKKPAGIYWLQAGAVQGLARLGLADTGSIWAYRIPSVAGAIGAVLALFLLLSPLVGRQGAAVAALLLATSLILTVEARLAKTDAVLSLCMVVMFGALARAYVRFSEGFPPARGAVGLFWAALAASTLLKGPVGPVLAALTLVTLRVWWKECGFFRSLSPLGGCLAVILVALPWFLAIQARSGGTFASEAVGHDLIGKLLGGQESHGQPPGFYLLLLPVLLWPLGPLVFRQLPRLRDLTQLPLARLALAWLVPGWVMFELIPTKLPHYVLPFLPALAVLTVLGIQAAKRTGEMTAAEVAPVRGLRDRILRGYATFGIGVWLLVCLALAGAAVAMPLVLEGRFEFWSIPVVAGALLVLATGWVARDHAGIVRFLWAGPLGAALVYLGVLQGILPNLHDPWLSRTIAAAVARHGGGPLASSGYREPSLVFMVGTGTLLTTPQGAAQFLACQPDGVVAITRDGIPAFADQATAEGVRVRELEQLSGFNYSRGDWVEMVLYGRGE
jgi:4-amino-4-deoxy-L-arabinose transferase-like glycosyltransferase